MRAKKMKQAARTTWQCWLLLLFLIFTEEIFICEAATCSRKFKMLYNGGTKVDVTYNTHGASSLVRCASTCNERNSCWFIAWDKKMKQCYIPNTLTAVPSSVAAPSSLITYYVSAICGKDITITSQITGWLNSSAACQDMGGRLYLPTDNAFLYIFHHVTQESRLWLGMYRYPDIPSVWYNMDGKPVNPGLAYSAGEPNNLKENEYYIFSLQGLCVDDWDGRQFKGICEI